MSREFKGFVGLFAFTFGVFWSLATFTDVVYNAIRKQQISESLKNIENTAENTTPAKFIGPRNIYPIDLSYTPELLPLIADSNFNYVNDRINLDNFPVDQVIPSQVNLQFVHFNDKMSWLETLFALADKGLRPADLKETLIFRANYPDETFKMPIVAFGSITWHPYGWFAMPYIQYMNDGNVCLDLTYGDDYDPCTMIAAVPISTK